MQILSHYSYVEILEELTNRELFFFGHMYV